MHALELGYNIVIGSAKAPNRHPACMPGMKDIWVKLVFEKKRGVILGGQIMGSDSAGELINVISACILNRMTADDIAMFQMGTHPCVTASPVAYQISNAAEIAVGRIKH